MSQQLRLHLQWPCIHKAICDRCFKTLISNITICIPASSSKLCYISGSKLCYVVSNRKVIGLRFMWRDSQSGQSFGIFCMICQLSRRVQAAGRHGIYIFVYKCWVQHKLLQAAISSWPLACREQLDPHIYIHV